MRSPRELRRETSCHGIWGCKQPRQDWKKHSHVDGFLPDLSTKEILGQCLSFRKQEDNRNHSALCQGGRQPFQKLEQISDIELKRVIKAMTESGRDIWMCLLFLVESLGRQKHLIYGFLVSHLVTWFKIKFFGYKLKFVPWLTRELARWVDWPRQPIPPLEKQW